MKFIYFMAGLALFLLPLVKNKIEPLTEPLANHSTGHFKFTAKVLQSQTSENQTILLENTSTKEVLNVRPPHKFFTLKENYGIATIAKSADGAVLTNWSPGVAPPVPLGRVESYVVTDNSIYLKLDNGRLYRLPGSVKKPFSLVGAQAFGSPETSTISSLEN